MRLFGARAAGVAGLVVLYMAMSAGSAWAPVPPRDCGMLREGGLYNVKADQLRCRRARRYTRRYLSDRTRPRGYSCKEYGRETKIEFRCAKGVKVFFAIRR